MAAQVGMIPRHAIALPTPRGREQNECSVRLAALDDLVASVPGACAHHPQPTTSTLSYSLRNFAASTRRPSNPCARPAAVQSDPRRDRSTLSYAPGRPGAKPTLSASCCSHTLTGYHSPANRWLRHRHVQARGAGSQQNQLLVYAQDDGSALQDRGEEPTHPPAAQDRLGFSPLQGQAGGQGGGRREDHRPARRTAHAGASQLESVPSASLCTGPRFSTGISRIVGSTG